MSKTSNTVRLEITENIGLIILNSPPVNALSHQVRAELFAAFKELISNTQVGAIVLMCEGNTFIAGADIAEFNSPPKEPMLRDIQDLMEKSKKPIIAAIHGTALGGGLELALCAHFRIAVASARFGLPEVTLGLIPGAGGTQRLPRLIGVEKALHMITFGELLVAREALALGLIDAICHDQSLKEGSLAFAPQLIANKTTLTLSRDKADKLSSNDCSPDYFSAFRNTHAKKLRGLKAAQTAINCVEASTIRSFEDGLAYEEQQFAELLATPESHAQRYYFFAERRAGKIPDIDSSLPSFDIHNVGIIGAGTMGTGIAMAFLNAGISVHLVETSASALDKGMSTIRSYYDKRIRSQKSTAESVGRTLSLLHPTLDANDLKDCDLIIEAVFERMEVKQSIFKMLDNIAKPCAILATNTSALDINVIADTTRRPKFVVGMHFFSPAHIMRLLEVVRADKTSKEVIATVMKLAKKINKIACVVGVSPGFVGNRMLYKRRKQSQDLLLEGAMPWDVDRAISEFGFPMGPFAISDLAGLDLGWDLSESKSQTIQEVLCESHRRGQKTFAGYYDYDEKLKGRPSPFTERVVKDFALKSGRPQRIISDQEILDRCLFAMINEGAHILDEKKALRSSDIDVIWVNGYGWPVYKGGPMYYADQMGLAKVLERMKELQLQFGNDFEPAPFLIRLVEEKKQFGDL